MRRATPRLPALFLLLLLSPLSLLGATGCSSSADPPSADATPRDGDATAGADAAKLFFGGERPAPLRVPAGYDAATAYPLVLLLHGLTANGFYQATYLGYLALFKQRGDFFLIAPDGTVDSEGRRYWNATPACCWNGVGDEVDDVAYLAALVAAIGASYNIDAQRIYLVGHSNGGYMSYRMACEHAETFAALVSLAGASRLRERCAPSAPVSVLQVHGDEDQRVSFSGEASYPGAAQSVANWAGYDGCSGALEPQSVTLDLDGSVAGAETSIARHSGCPRGVDAELWTMRGSGHVPIFSTPTVFAERTLDWLLRHPKPR